DPQVGIDENAPFPVVKRTIKGVGRAQGRPNRFLEHWAHNPAYWQPRGGLALHRADAGTRAREHELLAEEQIHAAAPPQGLTALPADAAQPYVFYVSATQRDPNFATDARRYLSAADFDTTWAGPGSRKSQQEISHPPRQGRQEARRLPAGTMGGTQAHEYLAGAGGRGGSPGQRLASHEWCHLIGDGDGGPDEFANLVIGTNAVNTEQLSMELALRD